MYFSYKIKVMPCPVFGYAPFLVALYLGGGAVLVTAANIFADLYSGGGAVLVTATRIFNIYTAVSIFPLCIFVNIQQK